MVAFADVACVNVATASRDKTAGKTGDEGAAGLSTAAAEATDAVDASAYYEKPDHTTTWYLP